MLRVQSHISPWITQTPFFPSIVFGTGDQKAKAFLLRYTWPDIYTIECCNIFEPVSLTIYCVSGVIWYSVGISRVSTNSAAAKRGQGVFQLQACTQQAVHSFFVDKREWSFSLGCLLLLQKVSFKKKETLSIWLPWNGGSCPWNFIFRADVKLQETT